MAHLVHGRAAEVIADDGPAGHGSGQDVAAVADVGRGRERLARARRAGQVGDVGGQGAVAEQLAAAARGGGRRREVRLEVDVEGRIAAAAQHLLHGGVVGVGGPRVVGGEGGVDEAEADAAGRVGLLQRAQLVGDHGRRDKAGLVCRGDNVKVRVDDLRLHWGGCKLGTTA